MWECFFPVDKHFWPVYENLIGDDTSATGRNADVLLIACKDVGLALNTGETKYMEIGRHRGVIQISISR
jgi:hypothetical protein